MEVNLTCALGSMVSVILRNRLRKRRRLAWRSWKRDLLARLLASLNGRMIFVLKKRKEVIHNQSSSDDSPFVVVVISFIVHPVRQDVSHVRRSFVKLEMESVGDDLRFIAHSKHRLESDALLA